MGTFSKKIWHGAAYYPELWPDQVDEDLRLMRETGIDLVRIGEFAWSAMEPEEGRYELNWLQQVMDKCHAKGIDVILCTPTPTPPRWMTMRYPEVLRIDRDGQPFQHGSRQHVSHTSPRYREFSSRITEELALHFGKHPALVAWQTDNEFLCHVDADYSDSAREKWHAWLKRKYGKVGSLNVAWDTRIWSETYDRIEDIPMPAKTPFDGKVGGMDGQHHCSLALDWGRFLSDSVVAFQQEQLDIIRSHSSAPITHNHIAQDRLFSEDLFANLDFAATDIYASHGDSWSVQSTLDWMRSAKMEQGLQSRPYMILETSPSHNGSTRFGHATHPPGFLSAEALMHLGLGGNAFCYWLWRQQKSGAEMCHGSVLTSWGTPSVGYKEVKAVSELIEKAGPILREMAPARAEVAVHESKNARAHFARAETFGAGVHFWNFLGDIYKPLLEMGLWRDRPFEAADVRSYKVVFSPYMPILTDSLVNRMEAFVRAGGLWIVGPLSGCRTAHGTVHTDAGLGRLDALLGMKTLWPAGLAPVKADFQDQETVVEGYSFGLEPVAADCRVVGRYLEGPAAGAAWCVERKLDSGRIVLLGSRPNRMRPILEGLLKHVGLRRLVSTWGTSVIPREGDGRKAYLLVNWDGNGGEAELPEEGVDLLTGNRMPVGKVKLTAFAKYAVLCGT